MSNNSLNALASPYKGSGNLTREQFYFYEMRTTAKLMVDGLTDNQIAEKIVSENLFQYPTERTIKKAVMKQTVERMNRSLPEIIAADLFGGTLG